MKKSANDRQTYDIPEVARILGVGQTTAYGAAKRGEIPALKIGGRYVVPRERFHRWMEEQGG